MSVSQCLPCVGSREQKPVFINSAQCGYRTTGVLPAFLSHTLPRYHALGTLVTLEACANPFRP